MSYIDLGDLIHDTDTGRFIPKREGNRHYDALIEQGVILRPPPRVRPDNGKARKRRQFKRLAETDPARAAIYAVENKL